MSVARVTEISATSSESFEAAIEEVIGRANRTLRNLQSAWVKDMNVSVEDGNIKGYRVNLEVTFVLDASKGGGWPDDALEGHRSGRLAGGLEA